jgi:DNA-binding transcriptional LysR family regulator
MVSDFERHVSDSGHARGGVIRVTCPEPIVQRMTPLIERFHVCHPNLVWNS